MRKRSDDFEIIFGGSDSIGLITASNAERIIAQTLESTLLVTEQIHFVSRSCHDESATAPDRQGVQRVMPATLGSG